MYQNHIKNTYLEVFFFYIYRKIFKARFARWTIREIQGFFFWQVSHSHTAFYSHNANLVHKPPPLPSSCIWRHVFSWIVNLFATMPGGCSMGCEMLYGVWKTGWGVSPILKFFSLRNLLFLWNFRAKRGWENFWDFLFTKIDFLFTKIDFLFTKIDFLLRKSRFRIFDLQKTPSFSLRSGKNKDF